MTEIATSIQKLMKTNSGLNSGESDWMIQETADGGGAMDITTDKESDSQDRLKVVITSLSTHQGSVLETVQDIYVSFENEGQIMAISLRKELEGQAEVIDGSNACAFFSIAFANWLENNMFEITFTSITEEIRNSAEELLTIIPRRVNNLREMSEHFSVEEALTILNRVNLCEQYYPEVTMNYLTGIKTEESKNSMIKALRSLNEECPSFAVFTCPPASFCIGCVKKNKADTSRTLVVIDTHCIPESVGGRNKAVIVHMKMMMSMQVVKVWQIGLSVDCLAVMLETAPSVEKTRWKHVYRLD